MSQLALDLGHATDEALYAIHYAFAGPDGRPDPTAPSGVYPNKTRRQCLHPSEYLCEPDEFAALVDGDWTHTSRACKDVLYRVERQTGPWVYDPETCTWAP